MHPEATPDPHVIKKAEEKLLPVHYRSHLGRVGKNKGFIQKECPGSNKRPKRVYQEHSIIVGLCTGCASSFRIVDKKWIRERIA